ncbi:recombinase family protein [Pseudarthrobacter albicanus]|uniref:recombinase family protein n=1 Tax=Pseudarthrobacter albicanus TaxID=2823873 RepID=UPI001BA71FAD|nr:recombinase family protein [Pseudarthrobacter albicanus]
MSNAENGLRMIGYVRVSTSKQDLGPEVQIADLKAEAERKGWILTIRREEAASGKSMANRPVLAQALADLKARKFDGLAVSKLDRLSRRMVDFAGILETSNRQRWALVCLDLGVDTSTTTGAAMAQVTMTFAEMERKRIGERVAGWHREKQAKGERTGGKSKLPTATVELVLSHRAAGTSMAGIADVLNAESVPTAKGGAWHASTIRQVLGSTKAQELMSA